MPILFFFLFRLLIVDFDRFCSDTNIWVYARADNTFLSLELLIENDILQKGKQKVFSNAVLTMRKEHHIMTWPHFQLCWWLPIILKSRDCLTTSVSVIITTVLSRITIPVGIVVLELFVVFVTPQRVNIASKAGRGWLPASTAISSPCGNVWTRGGRVRPLCLCEVTLRHIVWTYIE